MPSFSELRNGIGHSSSLKEGSKRSSCSKSVINNTSSFRANIIDHGALEQERMDRTNDVRHRLGPLIERLKDSVKNIQSLEDSMQKLTDGEVDGGSNCEMKDEHKHTFRSGLNPGQSRKLMNQHMEMVKKKMFRLKLMEEELASSEDRHLSLHHYMQQELSLQATCTEKKIQLPMGNLDYQSRIADLEEEIRLLKEKSALVDDLRLKNEKLLERTKNVKRLEHELAVEKSLRVKLDSNLYEHQCQMNEQAVKYDKLNCKFETLTSIIANLTEVLQAQENEIMDTMTLHTLNLANTMGPPKTIEHSETNESTAFTEPMSLSWTESSISNDDASSLDNDDSNAVEDSTICIEDPICRSTVQILREKIDALNRENAGLRESKSHTLNKYKSLHEEMGRQSSMIETLRSMLEGGEHPSTYVGS